MDYNKKFDDYKTEYRNYFQAELYQRQLYARNVRKYEEQKQTNIIIDKLSKVQDKVHDKIAKDKDYQKKQFEDAGVAAMVKIEYLQDEGLLGKSGDDTIEKLGRLVDKPDKFFTSTAFTSRRERMHNVIYTELQYNLLKDEYEKKEQRNDKENKLIAAVQIRRAVEKINKDYLGLVWSFPKHKTQQIPKELLDEIAENLKLFAKDAADEKGISKSIIDGWNGLDQLKPDEVAALMKKLWLGTEEVCRQGLRSAAGFMGIDEVYELQEVADNLLIQAVRAIESRGNGKIPSPDVPEQWHKHKLEEKKEIEKPVLDLSKLKEPEFKEKAPDDPDDADGAKKLRNKKDWELYDLKKDLFKKNEKVMKEAGWKPENKAPVNSQNQ